MLLEIENQLYRRVHNTIGQSAVVMRLAEELEASGKVAEQTMVIVSFVSGNTNNPNGGGAYLPTVRNRKLNYNITIVQKQVQREGHSFALPLLDLLADAVTGWVPEIPGLEFHTGFELGSERFVQVTEASQFIYEQTYTIEVIMADGRFFSQPCAAFDPIKINDFLPQRRALLTPDGKYTGLAIWKRGSQEYIVEDPRIEKAIGDTTEITCGSAGDGNATYRFIPRDALTYDDNAERVEIPSRITSGTLKNVWKCYRDNVGTYPEWFKLNIDLRLTRNKSETIGSNDEANSSFQDVQLVTDTEYFKEQ